MLKPVTNYGPIKSIRFPDNWEEIPQFRRSMITRNVLSFRPRGENDVSIELLHRGAPLDDLSAAAFHQALKNSSPERELSGDEIIELQFALGNAGNNQYTNRPIMGEAQLPPFQMLSTKVIRVNDRPVILAAGNFQDSKGATTSEYNGIFIDGKDDGFLVYEVFLQANDNMKFLLHLSEYEAALASIEWQ